MIPDGFSVNFVSILTPFLTYFPNCLASFSRPLFNLVFGCTVERKLSHLGRLFGARAPPRHPLGPPLRPLGPPPGTPKDPRGAGTPPGSQNGAKNNHLGSHFGNFLNTFWFSFTPVLEKKLILEISETYTKISAHLWTSLKHHRKISEKSPNKSQGSRRKVVFSTHTMSFP